MTDPITVPEAPAKPVNPEFFQQMAAALSTGDPSALLAATGATPAQVEAMKASMEKDDQRWAKMGAQLDNMADVIQYLADRFDKNTTILVNHLIGIERGVELTQRAMKKLPGFVEAYEVAAADVAERERLAKVAAEKAKSAGSPGVATSKVPQKVA